MLRSRCYQFVVSLTAGMGLISYGMQYGWSAPVLPILRSKDSPVKISPTDEIWLEAMFLLSSLPALPVAPLLTDKVGRQRTILLASTLSLIGWIIMGLANRVEYLYVARFLMGATSNILFVVVPMYISEIADRQIRGFLVGLVYTLLWTGLVVIYSVAPFVSFYVPSFVGGGLLVFQLITFSFMPESPYFLVAKGKAEAAKLSLQKLKAKEDCNAELEEITRDREAQKEEKVRVRDIILVKNHRRAFVIVGIIFIAQPFCAIDVVLMNLHTILTESVSVKYFSSETVGIVYAVLMCSAVIVCSLFVDKLGRKVLLIVSSVFTGLCLLSLAIYFNFKYLGVDVEPVSWLPIVCVMAYAVAYNLGLGPIPIIIASELFSNKVKVVSITFTDAIYVIFGALSLILYQYVADCFGIHVPFYLFGGVCFLAALFTVFFVPETKGKSLEEIQVMLGK